MPQSSVNSVCSVREKTPQRISSVLSHIEGAFSFSQKNTDEQNTQGFTETLSQPISQNLTATEASPPAPLRMERGVITEIPLHVLRMFSSPSPFISRPKGVTSHTTPLSIRRGAGGEASVNSVCRRRSVSSKRWLKSSVKSVSSVREKNLYEVCKQPNRGNLTYYSPPYGGGAGGGASWDRVLGHSFWG